MIENINLSVNVSEKILKHFKESNYDFITTFSLTMLERLCYSSYGLKKIFEGVDENFSKKIEYSSCIILRSIMSDYIILLNSIYIKNKKNEPTKHLNLNELEEFCLIMLCDSLNYAVKDIELLFKNEVLNEITKGNRKKLYLDLCSKYPP